MYSSATVRYANGVVGKSTRRKIVHTMPRSTATWYAMNGSRTACGKTLRASTIGVAHRTLPCGTLVSFKNPVNGRSITVPVVDRGPYVYGRQWDLTYATCAAIGHCWTGFIYWHYG